MLCSTRSPTPPEPQADCETPLLSYLRKNLKARNPASLEVCALLVKEGLQRKDPGLRYVGFNIPPDFVIGYGLDVAERYRNLPYVCVYAGEEGSGT